MKGQCDTRPTALRYRCCDAVVVTMGLVVVLAAIFQPEITFFLLGE